MIYNWTYFVDTAVVVAYLLGCLVVGFYKGGKISNIREYALGTGSISTFSLVKIYEQDQLMEILKSAGFKHIRMLKAFDQSLQPANQDEFIVYESRK